MGLISEDKIAEVRDRTDIIAVVGEYVTLKKAGVNWKGLCPFHQEKSPSFNVNQAKQFYHCFGCGKSGDVIRFIMEVEGQSFIEVAKTLAKRAGIDLPEVERSPRQERERQERESDRARAVRLCNLAADWFVAQLATEQGTVARNYLAERGIEKVAEAFRVGYAPAGWDALTNYFAEKRVPHELAEQVGLIRRRDNANLAPGAPPSKTTHFDVFVDRIVYALTSPVGEVIGFGGRVLPGAPADQPKYKNSPETMLYKKGENLFGLHLAKQAIRKSGRALVVEGNFDVMTLHERGVDYVVAPQGTAMTDAQVRLLQRFAKEVVLMLDADPAGRAATMKVIHRFVAADLKARIAQLRSQNGAKMDPDELARKDLPRLVSLIDHAVDAVEFYFEQVSSTAAPDVPGKIAAIEECVPLLASMPDPLARDLYLARLSELLKVDIGLIRRALKGAPVVRAASGPSAGPNPGSGPDAGSSPGPSPVVKRGLDPLVRTLISYLGQHPAKFAGVTAAAKEAVKDPAARALLEGDSFVSVDAIERVDPAIRDAVAEALLSSEFATSDSQLAQRMFEDILERLFLPDDTKALEEERKAALARGDFDRVRRLNVRILSSRKPAVTTR